jgi:geranylgeranyl pyrophosphate synthase
MTEPAPLPMPRFRTAIAERVTTRQAALANAARHLLASPGKGIRPLCVHLVGAAFAPSGHSDERHEQLGEAIELLHVGSLIHDDILDDANVRRGVPSVHVAYGAKVAVLAGDYLLARASQLVAGLHDPNLTRRLSEVIADLCEGELMQDEQLFDLEVTLESYLERVAKKTASPFELACEGGAIISGARGREAAAARRFGFHVGRLFQLVDDWLDWSGDAQALGKPVGRDLPAGSLTLPVLVALQHPVYGAEVRAWLTPFPTVVPPQLASLLAKSELRDQTTALVLEEAERARRWLLELPCCTARNELEGMLDKLVASVEGAPV